MTNNDFDVLAAEVRSPRDTSMVQFQNGLTAEDFKAAMSRKKRIARGVREIMVLGMWDAQPVFVGEDDTVIDVLREHRWQGMAPWWGHHKLHRAVQIADLRHPLALHLTKDDGSQATLRPQHLCRYARIINLAELTSWFFMPNDLVQGWPARDWPETMGRSETLEYAIVAHQERLRRRAYSMMRGNRLGIRGGAPKARQGHIKWESSRTLAGARLVTQVQAEEQTLSQDCH